MGTYPTCVCTQNDATPAATGNAHVSPHVSVQVSRRNSPKGRTA